jgi:uncharacterized protein YfaS (alpha-2-macroglobulin family)/tetratricopeptide (TPR) repeat protein
MKQFFSLFFCFLLLGNGGIMATIENLWQDVQEAEENKLPQTAVEHLDRIIILSEQQGLKGDFVRAWAKKVLNRAEILGKKPEEKVRILQEEIEQADVGVKPMLKLILAIWYWHYYEQNAWRFQNRTQTAGLSDDDFTTWDSNRLLEEVSGLFQELIKFEEHYTAIPLSDFSGLYYNGDLPESYCKTVFEFFVREAIRFYTECIKLQPAPQDAFVIDTATPVFAGLNDFLVYEPEKTTTDQNSSKLQVLILYRRLLNLLVKRGDFGPVIDTDLQRLRFVRDQGVGQNRQELFEKRMQEIAGLHKSVADATLALYELAEIEFSRQNYSQALKYCDEALRRFPDSAGALSCHNVKLRIFEKSFDVNVENTITQANSELRINYRNVEKLYFRVVTDKWNRGLNQEWADPDDYIEEEELKGLLRQKPVQSWSANLPVVKDYKAGKTTVTIPELPFGFYRLLVSGREDFKEMPDNQILYNGFWVTNTMLLLRNVESNIELMVLNATTGEPLSGEAVQTFRRNQQGRYRPGRNFRTDQDGIATITPENEDENELLIFVKAKTGDVAFPQSVNFDSPWSEPGEPRTVFFTDRAIYRPGQLIQFKGICLNPDHENRDYGVLSRQGVSVSLRDHNYQEVDRAEFATNEFGSFSGQFTAPSGTLSGSMQLVAEYPSGAVAFLVEEYKRPKFEVSLDALEKEFRLQEEVEVTGSARTFSGVSVAGARVKYRVVRRVRMPWWWRWYNQFETAQEIAHGEVKSDAAGKFSIKFTALPDLSVNPENDPSFDYELSVDVIDLSGETRSSSRVVRVGYCALEARLSVPEWLDADEKVPFTVQVNTLDGQALENSGSISIYSLKQPDRPLRKPGETADYYDFVPGPGFDEPHDTEKGADGFDYVNWEKDKLLHTISYQTGKDGQVVVAEKLAAGAYKAVLNTKDRYGKEVGCEIPLLVFSRRASSFAVPVPAFFRVKNTTVEPGAYLEAVFGTGYQHAAIYVAYRRAEKLLPGSGWQKGGRNFLNLMMQVTDELKGGFTLEVLFVQENQSYIFRQFIDVPWTDKKLQLSFATFRNRLSPGQKETWTVKIAGPDAELAVAELAATLYDASLDSFAAHSWSDFQDFFFRDSMIGDFISGQLLKGLLAFCNYDFGNWVHVPDRSYPSLPYEIREGFSRFFPNDIYMCKKSESRSMPPGVMMMDDYSSDGSDYFGGEGVEEMDVADGVEMMKEAAAPSTSDAGHGAYAGNDAVSGGNGATLVQQPALRTNLQETAFFFPTLVSDADGMISLSFTMPEALTCWRFIGLAHDQKLRSGLLGGEVITQKELMVEPNLPRFLRQGDQLYLSAKISNMSEHFQAGAVELKLLDADEERSVAAAYGLKDSRQSFSLEPGESAAFFFALKVPDVTMPLRYRFTAESERFSDGEEGLLPVLSRRILVRESLPLWISNQGQKKFSFDKLRESGTSNTIQHEKLMVQMTSNPAWYAVQALPYLAEFPYECTDQIFNRFYANSLGQLIAGSNPKIERTFAQWRGTDALLSNLQKNEDLKALLLAETPWVLEAKDEEQNKQNLALFFDKNRMFNELSQAMTELVQRQDDSGGWAWMPGLKPSFYITNYIAAGFGRLRHLGINIDSSAALKAFDYLDNELRKRYEEIKNHGLLATNNFGSETALYLYGRSFFTGEKAVAAANREAFDYFVTQAEKYWNKLDNRMSEAHTGLALLRLNKGKIPQLILKSLRERSRQDEELGMFWSDMEFSYFWYRAPIETQAMMIEYFSEMAPGTDEVERLQMWLLKQKQTQHWKTNKATADAVYALLLRGRDLLAEKQAVTVELSGMILQPEKVEAGTGYWEKRFAASEVKAAMGDIKISKTDDGIAWGGVFWEYFEDIAKITPHETPFSLTKNLFVREMTKSGPVIKPYEKQAVQVGDALIVRIVLRTDRDLEYVHMKDMRGSGIEPVNVLSGYRYQDGLGYYESTRDTATHFYFDYLPKGTYVFEYELRIFHRGAYESGMTEAQCLYAPEFSAHSESFLLQVQE